MAIETCARCGNQTAKLQKCDYCDRKICYSCIKSSKRKRVGKRYICKSCWSNITKRSIYKSTS
jgi:hypothetical protein